MKKIKRLIPLLLLVNFLCCMTVSAEESNSNALIQWNANEDQKGATMTVVPTEEIKEKVVTAMQITLQVEDTASKITDVTVSFDKAVTEAYRIVDYTYDTDKKELNIFLSDGTELFKEAGKGCTLGDVKIETEEQEYEVDIYPTSVKMVDQSHVTSEILPEDLQQMAVTLKSEETIDPEKPESGAVFDHADDVINELKTGQASNITLNIAKDGALSKEDQKAIFKELKGQDKSVTFAVRDESGKILYSITFRGDQITDENIHMDFKLEIGSSDKDIEGLMEKDSKSIFLDFAHSGNLPGNAEIKIYVGTYFADGEKLYLYYYNPDSKKVEPIQKDIIVIDGYVTFDLTHCSSYALTTKEIKEAGKFPVPGEQTSSGGSNDVKQKDVQTGDLAPITIYIVLSLLAVIAIIFVVFRRKRK